MSVTEEAKKFGIVFKLRGPKILLAFLYLIIAYYLLLAAVDLTARYYPNGWAGNRISEYAAIVPLVDQDDNPETINTYKKGDVPVGLVTITRHRFVETVTVHRTFCSNGYRDERIVMGGITNKSFDNQPVQFQQPISKDQQGVCYETYDRTELFTFLGDERTENYHYETDLYLVE